MSEYTTCPIWKTPAIEQRTGDGETVDSPRAGGQYSITGRAVVILQSRDESLKFRLTSWLIEQRRLGVDCPKISPTNLDEKERINLIVGETPGELEKERRRHETEFKAR